MPYFQADGCSSCKRLRISNRGGQIGIAPPAIELPTILGGNSVQVNNILCGLLYVSPTQINFVIPEGLSDGNYSVVINAAQGGTINISRVQPSIFAMNSDGQGVLAASVVRVKADGSQQYEAVSQFDATTNRMIPKPIDLGSAGERVFLEIYLTGIRQAQDENNDGNLNEHIFVVLGGKSSTPAFAGKQGFFAGIDQINVELPRALIGKGKLNLSIHGNVTAPLRTGAGFTSNAVELEIAPAKSTTPPTINNISVTTGNIGDLVVINGAGFGTGLFDNVVTFGGIKGDVEFANSTQLAVRIPYGGKSGKVKVVTSQGEAISPTDVTLRTSLSGTIETSTLTEFIPFPLQNITVRVAGTNLSTTTNQAGRFILNEVPSGAITLEIDPGTFALSTKFPSATLKTNIEAGRDNALPATIWLKETGIFSPTQSTEWNALTGVLTDTDGVTPVPNALIRLLGQDLLTTQTTTTDSSGSYVYRNIASSTIVAEVIHANGKVLQTSGAIDLSAAIGKLNGVGVLDLSLKNTPVNRKPIILAPATALMKATQTLDIPIYVADPDANDTLQVSVSGLQNALLIAGTNGAYTLRLKSSISSTFPVEIKAIDSQGNQATSIINVTIVGPTISIPQSVQVQVGQTLDIPFSLFDFEPNSKLQVSASGIQNVAVITSTNGGYALRVTSIKTGTFLVEIKAIDALGNQALSVINVITPQPQISAPATAQMIVGTTSDMPFNVIGFDPSVALQVSASGMKNVSIITGTNGSYILRITPIQLGIFPVEFKVSDSLGNLIAMVVTVTVVPQPNRSPSISIKNARQFYFSRTAFNVQVEATDPDTGQSLQLTANDLPVGATFTTSPSASGLIGTLTWIPKDDQAGSYPISFTVKDDGSPQLSITSGFEATIAASRPVNWEIINKNSSPYPVTSFAVDGEHVYIGGSTSGIHKASSLIGPGFTRSYVYWNMYDLRPLEGYIRSIAVAEDRTILSAVDGQGVFRTIDKNGTWGRTSLPPTDDTSRVAVSGNIFFSYNTNGGDAFYSNDKGMTWTSLGVTKFITDERGNNFAQGTDGKVYKISDNGNTIVKTLTNFPTLPITASCYDNKCFAATAETSSNTNTTYISINNGTDWNITDTLPAATYTSLFVIGTNIFANRADGAFVSYDDGISWSKMLLPAFDSMSLNGRHLFAKNGTDLYATTYILTKEGITQQIPQLPIESIKKLNIPSPVTSMEFDVSKIYAGTMGDGVMFSIDNGSSWQPINTGITTGSSNLSIYSLCLINGTVYAGTFSSGYIN